MPNRSVRRRQERDRRRGKPTVIIGDSIIAKTAQQIFAHDDIKTYATLPTKVPGKHRWVAMATYVVDMPEELIERADVNKVMGHHNMMYLGFGCWDCEQVWGEAKGTPCPAAGSD